MEMTELSSIKPVVWIGSTKADLSSFPEDVKDAIGYALYIAQGGGKHADARPLRGFSGAGFLEIVEDHAGDTSRRVHGSLGGTHIRLACVPRCPSPGRSRTEFRK